MGEKNSDLDSGLEEIADEENKSILYYLSNRFQKHTKHIKNYVILGFIGAAFFTTAVNAGLWIVFYKIAEKEKENIKQEIKLEINKARYDFKNDLEAGARQIFAKYLDEYAPGISKDLPLEKRIPLFFQNEEEAVRKKWMENVKSDLTQYYGNTYYGGNLSEEQMKKIGDYILENIKKMVDSGKLNFWKLVQPPQEKK